FAQKGIEGYEPEEEDTKGFNTIDLWIMGRLNQVIREFTDAMEGYEYHAAIRAMHNFFWHDFCDNYLEYVKHRVYAEQEGEGKRAAQYCLHNVLRNTVLLLAPLTPHISDELNLNIFHKGDESSYQSVHNSEWPSAGEVDEASIAKMETFNNVVSEIRQHKARNKLPQNAELEKLRLTLPEKMDDALVAELMVISKIKDVELLEGEFNVSVL
ncbi:TPA: hypothetical protein EYP38_05255, partial [Candidatus Micrarchaeota archaeon]|nr:hypothetical protein [Candidatus Micrarchaeota archaeon]